MLAAMGAHKGHNSEEQVLSRLFGHRHSAIHLGNMLRARRRASRLPELVVVIAPVRFPLLGPNPTLVDKSGWVGAPVSPLAESWVARHGSH